MIRNCSEFEERIQMLLDEQIDPETDGALRAHSVGCRRCGESLKAFSLLHFSFGRDVELLPGKLENLKQRQALNAPRASRAERWNLMAALASLAAMLLLLATLAFNQNSMPQIMTAANSQRDVPALAHSQFIGHQLMDLDLEGLYRWQRSLDAGEIVLYTSELPGLRPLKAIPVYLECVQQTLKKYSVPDGFDT